MGKMGSLWEWLNEGLVKFSGSQEMNFGRTFVVSFRLLPSVLGGLGYGRIRRGKDRWE